MLWNHRAVIFGAMRPLSYLVLWQDHWAIVCMGSSLSYRIWCCGITNVFDAMGSLSCRIWCSGINPSYSIWCCGITIVFDAMGSLSYHINLVPVRDTEPPPTGNYLDQHKYGTDMVWCGTQTGAMSPQMFQPHSMGISIKQRGAGLKVRTQHVSLFTP